jgi:hypothetical protein
VFFVILSVNIHKYSYIFFVTDTVPQNTVNSIYELHHGICNDGERAPVAARATILDAIRAPKKPRSVKVRRSIRGRDRPIRLNGSVEKKEVVGARSGAVERAAAIGA